jgi:hypothetical protein
MTASLAIVLTAPPLHHVSRYLCYCTVVRMPWLATTRWAHTTDWRLSDPTWRLRCAAARRNFRSRCALQAKHQRTRPHVTPLGRRTRCFQMTCSRCSALLIKPARFISCRHVVCELCVEQVREQSI